MLLLRSGLLVRDNRDNALEYRARAQRYSRLSGHLRLCTLHNCLSLGEGAQRRALPALYSTPMHDDGREKTKWMQSLLEFAQ